MNEPQPTDPQDCLLDMNGLCELTKLSRAWLYEMLSEKAIPIKPYRFGKSVRFKRSDVWSWIEQHKDPPRKKRIRIRNVSLI